MDAFKDKFRIDDLLLARVGAWNISLRPKQVTIGSLVLSLDRQCPEMSGLTSGEAADLSKAFLKIEEILQTSFKPQKLNYLALMMVDHQVHFHVIPRYENPVEWRERFYPDKDWPKPPQLSQTIDLIEEELVALKNLLMV